jgi:hypothetical protein
MLVACRLAGLSALEAHYADDNAQAQSGPNRASKPSRPSGSSTHGALLFGGKPDNGRDL